MAAQSSRLMGIPEDCRVLGSRAPSGFRRCWVSLYARLTANRPPKTHGQFTDSGQQPTHFHGVTAAHWVSCPMIARRTSSRFEVNGGYGSTPAKTKYKQEEPRHGGQAQSPA